MPVGVVRSCCGSAWRYLLCRIGRHFFYGATLIQGSVPMTKEEKRNELKTLAGGRKMKTLIILAMVLLFTMTANAKEHKVRPNTWDNVCAKLQPGDTMVMTPGKYRGLHLLDVHGTPEKPIIIKGRLGKTIIECNKIDNWENSWGSGIVARGNSNIRFTGITFDGLDIGKSGINMHRSEDSHSTNIIVEECEFKNFNNADYEAPIGSWTHLENLIVRNCTFENALKAVTLHSHESDYGFSGVILENNVFHNIKLAAIYTKGEPFLEREDGIHLVIRYNTFLTEDEAQHLVYLEAKEPASIYGNTFYGNSKESMIMANSVLVVHDNLFIDPQENASALEIDSLSKVYHNTFLGIKEPFKDGFPSDLVFGNIQAKVDDTENLLNESQNSIISETPDTYDLAFLDPLSEDLVFVELEGIEQQISEDLDYNKDFYGRRKPQYNHCGAISNKSTGTYTISSSFRELVKATPKKIEKKAVKNLKYARKRIKVKKYDAALKLLAFALKQDSESETIFESRKLAKEIEELKAAGAKD